MKQSGLTTAELRGATASPQPEPASAHGVHRVDLAVLLGGGRELVIVHQNDEYRLRITRNGKLILTK
ncbi:MAG TPA: hemin uptake protein HemP [Alphaproteobacteria bacterium]|nr:hemin uptake protein HemP [Alphaproteobacteria bacterium]